MSDPLGPGRRILAIGDSHTKFWTGEDTLDAPQSVFRGVDTVRLGGATAHNLFNPKSEHGAGPRLLDFLLQHWKDYGCVIVSFGEIDCRVHLVRTATQRNISLQEAVDITANNYVSFVREIFRRWKLPVLLWGPAPPDPIKRNGYDRQWPTFGSLN